MALGIGAGWFRAEHERFGFDLLEPRDRFDRQVGAAVPAHELAAMVAVAVALRVAQPEVEVLGEARPHGGGHRGVPHALAAGAMVPAAVIIIGIARPKVAAASMTAL